MNIIKEKKKYGFGFKVQWMIYTAKTELKIKLSDVRFAIDGMNISDLKVRLLNIEHNKIMELFFLILNISDHIPLANLPQIKRKQTYSNNKREKVNQNTVL